MITTSRSEVERLTRSYFEPQKTPAKKEDIFYFSKCPRVKIPDDVSSRMKEAEVHDAIANKAHQEYLARRSPNEESLLTQYGKLTTDQEREAFIQKLVDKHMAAYEAINKYERQQQEVANHGMSVASADQSNASARSAAIGMYQSVQYAGDSASTSEQGKGVAA